MTTFFRVGIQGLSPLLMHRFTEEATIAVENSPSRGRAKFNPKTATPREVAFHHAYWDETTKHLVLPTQNLYSAIVAAGIFQKIGRKQITTRDTSLVPAGLWIHGQYCDLGTGDFEVDSRRIVNANNGNPAIAHRPRMDTWRCEFVVEVDLEMFDEAIARRLIDDAGKKIGVGAYRPQRKGPFGRFIVNTWKEDTDFDAGQAA